jgi:coatomer subunit beta
MMKANQAIEKQCTYLIYNEAVVRAEPGELAAGLENNDVREKIATMKKLIQLMLNGEQLGSLLMKVIQFVVPNEDKQLKKLLYLYLEAVEKRSPNGHLLPEMILICNMIRNDLNHPNEFVRGSALRFLSKIREKDILEPLVASLRVNLEHRHSYVRRNAVLAIYNTFKCFEDLMPDAPELIAEFIDGESDVSAKRNAFVMLCNCDQVPPTPPPPSLQPSAKSSQHRRCAGAPCQVATAGSAALRGRAGRPAGGPLAVTWCVGPRTDSKASGGCRIALWRTS